MSDRRLHVWLQPQVHHFANQEMPFHALLISLSTHALLSPFQLLPEQWQEGLPFLEPMLHISDWRQQGVLNPKVSWFVAIQNLEGRFAQG